LPEGEPVLEPFERTVAVYFSSFLLFSLMFFLIDYSSFFSPVSFSEYFFFGFRVCVLQVSSLGSSFISGPFLLAYPMLPLLTSPPEVFPFLPWPCLFPV